MWIEQKENGKFLFREKFIDNLTEKEKTDTLKMDDYLKKYSIDNEIKLLGLEQTKQTFELINNNLYSEFVEDKLLNILKSKIIFLNSDKQNINCSIVSEYRTKKHLFNFSRESQEKMITLRNKNWIDKIDKTIQENKKALRISHQCSTFGKVLSYSAATTSTEVSTKD